MFLRGDGAAARSVRHGQYGMAATDAKDAMNQDSVDNVTLSPAAGSASPAAQPAHAPAAAAPPAHAPAPAAEPATTHLAVTDQPAASPAALPLAEADRIPNLDYDACAVAVPLPAPAGHVKPSAQADALPGASANGPMRMDDDDTAVLASELAALPTEAQPATPARARSSWLAWLPRLRWRRKPRLPAHLRKPRRSPGEWLYTLADNTLARLNTPLAARDPVVRSLVGLAATATLVLCLLANFVLPHVIRPRTALTFLQEQVAALELGPQPAQAAPAHDGHH